ncbi:hypothetical protein CK203_056397 [Vitis vinifera]|uniref:Retrotransposon Copia-like N-terminal domain-containing protein n=1 Tax=Vitis vinifera TaxID=29760 RepID=A0A438GPA3_VITVI|nr:hypothetical protein CK203_056397 [Vitis vinifera]
MISINVAAQTPLKLTSTNYVSWKLQFQTLFIGYNLLGFIDGSHPCPTTILPGTTTTKSSTYTLDQAGPTPSQCHFWFFVPHHNPFIAQAKQQGKPGQYWPIHMPNHLVEESSR